MVTISWGLTEQSSRSIQSIHTKSWLFYYHYIVNDVVLKVLK